MKKSKIEKRKEKLYALTPLSNSKSVLIRIFAVIITFCLRWYAVFIMGMRAFWIIKNEIPIQCRSEFFSERYFLR